MTSFSRPWKPSTVFTSTLDANLDIDSGNASRSFAFSSSSWARYGVMIPTVPWNCVTSQHAHSR